MKKVSKQILVILILVILSGASGIDVYAGADEDLLNQMGFDFVVNSKAINSIKNSKNYYVLGMGLAVDASCFKIYPEKKLPKVLQQMLVRGLSCMKRVERGDNLARDLESFRKLLSNKNNLPKIECDKPLPDTAYAIGSSPGSSRNHPYIWLSSMGNKEFILDSKFFEGVIFHELIHNIRYFHHPDDLEVTSACEECCFGKMGEIQKEQACKICGGAYETLDDPEYIKSLLVWDGKFYGRILAEENFTKAMKDPALLKSQVFKNAVSALIAELKYVVKPERAFVLIEQIAAGEFEKVESELNVLPDQENAHRARFFFYRLMSTSVREKGNLAQAKIYQEKAESFRRKFL